MGSENEKNIIIDLSDYYRMSEVESKFMENKELVAQSIEMSFEALRSELENELNTLKNEIGELKNNSTLLDMIADLNKEVSLIKQRLDDNPIEPTPPSEDDPVIIPPPIEEPIEEPEVEIPPIQDGFITEGLILHYDFTNKKGDTSNTIHDLINGVPATFETSQDGIVGFKDNVGLSLSGNSSVKIPTDKAPLNTLIDFNNPDGVSVFIVTQDVHWNNSWKTAKGSFDHSYTSGGRQQSIEYVNNEGKVKSAGVGSYWLISMEDWSTYLLHDKIIHPKDSKQSNITGIRINPNKSVNVFTNKYTNYDTGEAAKQQEKVISDLSHYTNELSKSPLLLRKGGFGASEGKIIAFLIYNRALSNEEITHLNEYYKEKDELIDIRIFPKEINLKKGESQIITYSTLPSSYNKKVDFSLESGNTGYATVSPNGLVTGVSDGETLISVVAKYKDKIFTENVHVKVGEIVKDGEPIASSRVVNGVAINRKVDELEVGEYFSAMATTLSEGLLYDIFDENIVVWESSNPQVASIQYGVIKAVSEGETIITAYDSTKTYSSSFTLKVVKKDEVILSEEEIYNVPFEDYSIKLDNTDSINTTKGIINALNFAKSNNYKKIVFPYGTYLINPVYGSIYIPSDMIVDFSDSTINIEVNEFTLKGYRMFRFSDVKNTKLINAHVFGERDHTTVKDSKEGCISLLFEDCYKSGIENCTFSKSPGFNVVTGTKRNHEMGIRTKDIPVARGGFELGNIGENGQLDNSKTANYYRYKSFIDISGLGSEYLLGYTQGYHGYPHLRSRLYSLFFYDENYNFVTSQMYNLQYYNYKTPKNVKYAKIVIYQASPPTSGDSDFGGAVAFLRTMGIPRNCFVKNCKFEDNTSTGMAMCGGQNWLLEENKFANNKGRTPGCDIDWEDGWEHMVGDVVVNNEFNSANGVIVCAGGSIALFNNTLNRTSLYIWGRTQNWRIFNNRLNEKAPSLSTQGDSVFARNILKGIPSYTLNKNHSNANYRIHDLNNVFID